MTEVRFILAALFFALGAAAILLSVIGVYKFRFVMNRMHAAAIIDAMAVLFILIGLAFASGSMAYIPKLALVLIFLWIGSPIASHMVGRLEISTDDSVRNYMKREDAAAESAEYRVDDWENSESAAYQSDRTDSGSRKEAASAEDDGEEV